MEGQNTAGDRDGGGDLPVIANRVAIYARVSTRGQEVENQLMQLRAYAAARGWTVTEEFTDVGCSGAKDSRPALNRLMGAARKRKIDVVLVWKFDRFARSTKHLVAALEEFRELGVSFVAQEDAIDTTTAAGKLVFVIISAMAEFERSLIRERIYAGLHRARAQGKRLGRPRRVVDEQQVRALRAAGHSLRAIARAVGISKDAVASIAASVIPPRIGPVAPTAI